jgi:hypothetical protein
MLVGDAHAKDSGPNAKVQRWIEHECLAVDASGHGAVGVASNAGADHARHGR